MVPSTSSSSPPAVWLRPGGGGKTVANGKGLRSRCQLPIVLSTSSTHLMYIYDERIQYRTPTAIRNRGKLFFLGWISYSGVGAFYPNFSKMTPEFITFPYFGVGALCNFSIMTLEFHVFLYKPQSAFLFARFLSI